MPHDRSAVSEPAHLEAAATERAPWVAVGVLLLVATLNYVDRQLPFILADAMKADLGLSDTALGFINGLGFLIVYAVMGLPLARLTDRVGRYGLVIGVAVGFWSLMTALGGACQTMWQLALSRVGVAVGESANTPAAHAFVAKRFEADRRALPLAVITLAGPLGGMLGLMAGGYLEEAVGWRATFVVMGAVGLVLAFAAPLALRSGAQGPHRPKASAGGGAGGLGVLLRNRSYRRVVLAAAITAFATYSVGAFAPSLLRRVYEMSPSHVGAGLGTAKGILGVAFLLAGGFVVDRLAARSPRWMALTPAIMLAASVPIILLIWLTDDVTTTIIALAIGGVIGPASTAPAFASLQSLSPPHLRASAAAFLLFVNAAVGGVGPLAVGALSDALAAAHGPQALRLAMLIVPAAYALAALAYLWASRDMAADVQRDGA